MLSCGQCLIIYSIRNILTSTERLDMSTDGTGIHEHFLKIVGFEALMSGILHTIFKNSFLIVAMKESRKCNGHEHTLCI